MLVLDLGVGDVVQFVEGGEVRCGDFAAASEEVQDEGGESGIAYCLDEASVKCWAMSGEWWGGRDPAASGGGNTVRWESSER